MHVHIGEMNEYPHRCEKGFPGAFHSPIAAPLSQHDPGAIEAHFGMHAGRRLMTHVLGEPEHTRQPAEGSGQVTIKGSSGCQCK